MMSPASARSSSGCSEPGSAAVVLRRAHRSARSASSSAACRSIASSCRTGSTSAAALLGRVQDAERAAAAVRAGAGVRSGCRAHAGSRTHVLATAQRGSVGFDLWSSIRNARLTAGRFALESPEIGADPHQGRHASSCSAERAAGARQAVRARSSCPPAASTFATRSSASAMRSPAADRGRCRASISM